MKSRSSTKEQAQLLQKILQRYPDLPAEIVEAYEEIPRHRFIRRFSPDRINWVEVNEQNYSQHADLIYADFPLLLFDDLLGKVCTISQPSFVLSMLRDLDLRPGHQVFELGAGSGWNAALMGHIVGARGSVTSVEIIPEMARQAKEIIAALHLEQVHVKHGDAMEGDPDAGPYDRGIFTAGAPDLPPVFFEEIKLGGKLLFVLKDGSSNDLLLHLMKRHDHFEITHVVPCFFVPVVGAAESVAKTKFVPELQERLRGKIFSRKGERPEGEGVVASEFNWWKLS